MRTKLHPDEAASDHDAAQDFACLFNGSQVHLLRHEKTAGEAGGKACFSGWQVRGAAGPASSIL